MKVINPKNQPAHALLSASGAHRWMNCTPSARFEEDFPNMSSSFAEEGTLAHKVAEKTPVKGWKLVQGRGKRQYTDPDSAKSALVQAGFQEEEFLELSGIPTLEKRWGKEVMEEVLGDLIEFTFGKPSLVPDTDKRPSIHLRDEVLADFD